jgi:enolase
MSSPDQPFAIDAISAREILDSRGRPTVEVAVTLADGVSGRAAVPSGASTGSREAVEIRDGDPKRFAGLGVRKAVAAAESDIAQAVRGRAWNSLAELDRAMIELDGTPTKSRLGANAIVGVSMAAARALSAAAGTPLYRWLNPPGVELRLPAPHFNVINGGAHAANQLAFQEFMIAPIGAGSISAAVQTGAEVYQALRALLLSRGLSVGLGDEGGFAPEIDRPEEACELLVTAIERAGHTAAVDHVAIALDPAASEFYRDGAYHLNGETVTTDELIDRYSRLIDDFPIWSLEDGLAEDDDGWSRMNTALSGRVQIMGDDIFVTDPAAIETAVADDLANCALIKLNQVGTVTETLQALAVCRAADWGAMISHRSGETTDPFIADLAVASGCGQIKAGAPARGERVAKYNRLMEIGAEIPDAPYGRLDR